MENTYLRLRQTYASDVCGRSQFYVGSRPFGHLLKEAMYTAQRNVCVDIWAGANVNYDVENAVE